MANVRCPMCSKVNPPEAEMCGFCGARIKPLRPTSTPAASAPQNDEPDWLRGLSQGTSSQPAGGQTGQPPAGKSSGASSDVPDWLSRIRDKARDNIGGDISIESGQSDDEPDWIKGLQDDQAQAASDSDIQGEDWLSRLQDEPSKPASGSSPFVPPATPPPTQPSPPTPASPFGDTGGTPDWMRSLSDDISSTSGEEPALDWLSGSSDTPAFDFSAPSQDAPAQGGEDDWMSKLSWGAEPQESEPPAEAPSGGQEDLDWMRALNFGSEPPAAQEPPAWQPGAFEDNADTPPGSGGFGLTGFLSNLDDKDSGLGAPSQPPANDSFTPQQPDQGRTPSGFGLTGFLQNLESDQPGAPQTPDSGEPEPPALTDWGQTFGAPENAGIDASSSAPESPTGGMLEWLSGESSTEPWEIPGASAAAPFDASLFSGEPSGNETPAPSGGEQADEFSTWFSSMDSGSTETPAAPSASQAGSDEGLPDWLSGAPAEPPASSTPSRGPVMRDQGGLPAWLSSSEPAEPPAPAQPTGESSMPAWLADSDEFKPPAAPSAAQPVEPSADSSMPAWLAGFNEPAAGTPEPGASDDFSGLASWMDESSAAQQPAESFKSEPAAASDVPDWFSSLTPTSEPAEATQTGGLSPFDTDFNPADFGAASFSASDAVDEEEKPAVEAHSRDWLSSLQQPSAPVEADAEPADGVPSWLRDFNAPVSDGASSVPPLLGEEAPAAAAAGHPFDVDLPDWLGEEAAPRAETASPSAELTPGNLAQADLPDWVQKMRPLESVIPGDALPADIDQRVEKAGPLAGLRGVLPAEEMVTRYRKPPTYSIKLRVTEKQRAQASLLENLLAQESQPLLVKPDRSQAPRVFLRLLLAVLLLVVVTLPLIFGIEPLGRPVLAPDDLLNMYEKLDSSVQQDSPVLLAVDYEPALAGEMNLTAASVVDHLMAKGARIVVVSTVTSGPALAERLIADAAARRGMSAEELAERTVNLGYLTGGTISLLEFAQQPQLAAPVTLAGRPAWSQPALSGIRSLAGFSQVIVVTDTAETGRAWIEQVQPMMGQVPLFMVVSAQAAPLILPYVESSQVSGMVSGMMGGVMYGWKAGQTNNPTDGYFAAYQIGILLALLLVLIGGLYSGIMALIKRKDKAKNTDEA